MVRKHQWNFPRERGPLLHDGTVVFNDGVGRRVFSTVKGVVLLSRHVRHTSCDGPSCVGTNGAERPTPKTNSTRTRGSTGSVSGAPETQDEPKVSTRLLDPRSKGRGRPHPVKLGTHLRLSSRVEVYKDGGGEGRTVV